ncbi:hypothetical protein Tco_0995404 [Tanacetum coccineum]
MGVSCLDRTVSRFSKTGAPKEGTCRTQFITLKVVELLVFGTSRSVAVLLVGYAVLLCEYMSYLSIEGVTETSILYCESSAHIYEIISGVSHSFVSGDLPCIPTTPPPLLPIHQYLMVQASHHHGGIPLVNAGKIPNMDPYKEVTQHGQAHPLSPAYVPDPMELDEHVPMYVLEHPEHHDSSEENVPVEDQPDAEDADSHGFLADSDSMEDDTDADSIDYPDEPEDGKDDDEDPEEDPSEEHESEDEEAKEDEPFKDSDETEPFKEDETAATPPSPGRHRARITVRPQPPMAAST